MPCSTQQAGGTGGRTCRQDHEGVTASQGGRQRLGLQRSELIVSPVHAHDVAYRRHKDRRQHLGRRRRLRGGGSRGRQARG